MLQLPKPVAAYFSANVPFDVDGMLAPFAADAIVADERQTHQGRTAIRAWIEQATVGNKAVATPQAATHDGPDVVVSAVVAGAFPSSPVTLSFRFTLADSHIARLEIA